MEQNKFVGFIIIISFAISLQLPSSLADPADGFTEQDSKFVIQWPYDKRQDQRYSFINGVHSMWVFDNDKPHTPTSKTKPRTEMGFATKGNNGKYGKYVSGVWQFEADMYVPSGSTGVAC
ncbi:citrate-binding protein [Cryptomeria japonica]|uniref:citrate-binding protein n=1 Tax=Cryptomeria japonica TaxID=3369 RepID=UPI0027DA8B26|nr:citrate-binding protein [Cryptomeria japonica]